MPEEIRGLNIKFDADFTEFKKSMNKASQDISSTQRQLKTLQQSLKLSWDPTKFRQAQTQAQQALQASEAKATLLKQRLKELEAAGVTDKTRAEYNYLTEEIEKADLATMRLKEDIASLDDLRLQSLTAGLDKVTGKLETAANKTKVLSGLATAAVAGIAAASLNAVETADEIATMASKYELSAESLQRFNYVAMQTNVKSEAMYQGFNKVRLGVSQLASGVTSGAAQAFEQLNLSFDEFEGTEDQFYAVIKALSQMEDQTQMLTLANMIFGDDLMGNLLPLIYAGSDAINQYNREFEETGALTNEQVAQLSKFDGVLDKLKLQYTNVAVSLGTSLLPLMESLAKILEEDVLPVVRDLVEWFDGLDESQQKTVISLLMFMAALSPTLSLLSKTGKTVSSVIGWLNKLDKATVVSTGKWIMLGLAISSLLAVLANWTKMNTVQKVIGLLGALSAAALAAAVAFGVFHSAWSIGIAIAGMVAGIATATAAVAAAGKDIGSAVGFTGSSSGYYGSSYVPSYTIPSSYGSSGRVTNNDNSYVDNSNVVINIEKNEYVNEDDIIRAVNKGLKQARMTRK